MLRKILILMTFGILLAGCGKTSPASTPDMDSVSTIVAVRLTEVATTIATVEDMAVDTAEAATVTSAPTNTPIIETSTPTFTPSPTLTATATPKPTLLPDDPRAVLGSPTWRAAFKDDSNWYTFETEQSSIQVENGTLVLTAFLSNSYENWSMSWPKLTDFYLEITATTGDSCRGRDRYGLIFRAPDPNQGYLFGISCDGSYRVRQWDGEAYSELVKWKTSEHILAGPNQINRLGVKVEGSEISVYVNGYLLEELKDNTYARGLFGAYIAASETAGFEVVITEAAYWEIPE
jgi:hypothetical protein